MADEQQTTPAVTPGNDPAARTTTGEIKDQQTAQPQGIPDPKASETKSTDSTTAKTDDKATDAKADDKAAKAEPGKVPEKYDLKAPEGYEIDPKLVEEFTPIAKELGLTQEAAQKLTDLWNKHSIESAEAPYKAYEAQRQTWRDEIAKDPALGDGKSDLSAKTRENISKAFDAIGDAKVIADFKAAMDLTGAGDNPAFVRAMNSLGKLLSEGTLVKGTSPSPAGQAAPGKIASPAQALYPNLPSSASS